MTAHWRKGRIGVALYVDGEPSVTAAKNGSEWRAWGDVSYGNHSRAKVVERVLEACRDAEVTVMNACPEE